MSFILDALKKSETERQQQSPAEFAGVPTNSGAPGIPRWLWALGLLLAINLAVLVGLFVRPDVEPEGLVSTPAIATPAPVRSKPNFAEQVDKVRQNAPVRQEPDAATAGSPSLAAVATPTDAMATTPPRQSSALPNFFEVRANGIVEIPDLHLDIHVYSTVPEDRFVFINMSKHRENSQLSEGPLVEEITPDGVVLEYRGTSFLLPRD